MRNRSIARLCLSALLVLVMASLAGATAPDYDRAKALGVAAGTQAAQLLKTKWNGQKVIVVTNAGHSLPQGHSTQGCLDGLSQATGASVGASTLITTQTRFDQPLWFAFYLPQSGQCAYLQYGPAVMQGDKAPGADVAQVARIDAEHLFANPEGFIKQQKAGLFGPNLFRVVTISNAAAKNCDDETLKAIQIHDHFCPGVTSGTVLAKYVRLHLLNKTPKTRCFVLTLKPWCKEDALTTLLNTTPGKRAYAVLYPTEEQIKAWPKPLDQACNVIFTQAGKGQPWHGTVLGFDFAKAKALYADKSFGSKVLDKLYADVWFLNNEDKALGLVSVLKQFDLPKGQSPKDLIKPGSDVVQRLSAL